MTHLRLVSAAILVSALVVASGLAQARTHHHHWHHYGLPYEISYNHNYGPGALPDSFAYYDGPSTNFCYRGSATYLGQDHRRYPCF